MINEKAIKPRDFPVELVKYATKIDSIIAKMFNKFLINEDNISKD